MHTQNFFRQIVLGLAFLLFGCTAQQNIESTATIVSPTQGVKTITITGILTTIWNGGPHYSITDDQGQETKLLLADETAKPLGGPLALDRKRVTITGELTSDSPRTVQVQSVQFANTTVTITGMFTTIWNGGPHYSITDDQGQETKLLLADETARPLGGPLALDRKRVTITGELTSGSPRTVQVQSVQFANP